MNTIAIAEYIDQQAVAGNATALVALLGEQYEGYTGKGSNDIMRLKGYAMAAFAKTGMPAAALPYIADELQNGMHAYTVAAAAIAIRALPATAHSLLPCLFSAMYNMLHMDDAVSFDAFTIQYPLPEYTTAQAEVLKTIQWLQPADKGTLQWLLTLQQQQQDILSKKTKSLLADAIETIQANAAEKGELATSCCDNSFTMQKFAPLKRKRVKKQVLNEVVLEDQGYNSIPFRDFFTGRLTVAIFFYTRCDNPNKCSLSVSRMAQLQYLLQQRGITDANLAAISYDNTYDTPDRLKSYGNNRGFAFDAQHRFFRVTKGYDTLKAYLQLGVNYNATLVNHHTIELYIFDKTGSLKTAQTRMQWQPEAVADALEALQQNNSKLTLKQTLRITGNTLAGIAVAFFPKCPACWAGYMSLFGAVGLQSIPYTPQLLLLFMAGLGLNLYVHYRLCRKRKRMMAFMLNLAGIAAVICGYLTGIKTLSYTGIILLIASSLFINLYSSFARYFFQTPYIITPKKTQH